MHLADQWAPNAPAAQAKPAWLRDVPAHWHRLALIATAAAEPPEIDEEALKDALDRAFEENEPLTPKRTRAVVVVKTAG